MKIVIPDLNDTRPPIRGTIRTDDRARAAYAEAAGIHRLVPTGIARPADLCDLQTLIRWARQTGAALIFRGAGSSMGGGAVGTGWLVDLRDLGPRRLVIDADARVAHLTADVTLAELDAAAAPHGLRFPVDPSSRGWATVGGTLATNAAGPRTVRDGPMRSWTRALIAVDGRGDRLSLGEMAAELEAALRTDSASWGESSLAEPAAGVQAAAAPDIAARDREPVAALIDAVSPHYADLLARLHAARHRLRDAFPATTKNTCGYALDHAARGGLAQLLIGSEGTLGVITAATLALQPIPAEHRALRVVLPHRETLPEAVALLRAHAPAAIELLDRSFLALVLERLAPELQADLAGAGAVLLVELESDDAVQLQSAITALEHALVPLAAALTVARTPAESAALWALRHAASPILAGLGDQRRSLQVIEDGCVPVARLADYLEAVETACTRAGVPYVCFGHAGDGHVHVNLLPDAAAPDLAERLAAIYAQVNDAVLQLGGTPSGEHGDGRLRAPLVPQCYPDDVLALMAAVKAAFDPDGIFAPGVKLDLTGTDPFASLKVGAAAAVLPADIEAGLRRIERERGWATDRLTLADD